jgi:hypothetical protein
MATELHGLRDAIDGMGTKIDGMGTAITGMGTKIDGMRGEIRDGFLAVDQSLMAHLVADPPAAPAGPPAAISPMTPDLEQGRQPRDIEVTLLSITLKMERQNLVELVNFFSIDGSPMD